MNVIIFFPIIARFRRISVIFKEFGVADESDLAQVLF